MPKGRRLTIDVPALFRMHAEGKTRQEICVALGIRIGSWWAICERYRLPKKVLAKKTRGPASPDPTFEEIQQRCLEVQSTWSPEERERRIVDRTGRVRVKNYGFNGRDCAFSALRY